MPEAEPDAAPTAAPTAAPGCPYAPDPLDVCEPPRLTEPACVVEIEGAERVRAVHYDANGARVARYGPDGLAWAGSRDPARGWRLGQAVVEGCVTAEREVTRLADGFRVRDRDGDGELCIATDDATNSETMWEGLRAIDPGCDCRDVDIRRDCVSGPHGPLRCEHFGGGGLTRVETWLYNEAGQVARHIIDLRGRAAVFDRTLTYDAEGRQIEELFLCPSCTGATVTRDTWTYEPEKCVSMPAARRDPTRCGALLGFAIRDVPRVRLWCLILRQRPQHAASRRSRRQLTHFPG